MADSLLNVNKDTLGEGGKTLYDQMTADVFPGACETLYSGGTASLEVANYDTAIASLGKVVRMDENYDSGGALLNLGLAYMRNGDNDNAAKYLKRVIELFPDTDNAQEAQNGLNSISQGDSPEGDTDPQSSDSGNTGGDGTGNSDTANTDTGNTDTGTQDTGEGDITQ